MKRKIMAHLITASNFANKGDKKRHYSLGAIGIRSDGVVVTARNSAVPERTPQAHAEARLAKKLTPNSVVFVCRTTKNGENAMAKPCESCQRILKSVGVKKVYYSTLEGFESLNLK